MKRHHDIILEKVIHLFDTQEKKDNIIRNMKEILKFHFVKREFFRVIMELKSRQEISFLYNDLFTFIDIDYDGILSMDDIKKSLFPEHFDKENPLYEDFEFSGFRVEEGMAYGEFMIAMIKDDIAKSSGDGFESMTRFFSGVEQGVEFVIDWSILKVWVDSRGLYLTQDQCSKYISEFCGKDQVSFLEFLKLVQA